MDSHFASLPRWAAAAVLLLVAVLIGHGLVAPAFPPPPLATGADSTRSDLALYGAVLNRVQAGEGFYQATATEQRLRGYPLRPFVTVRPPWFTRFLASVGGRVPATRIFRVLVTSAAILMVIRLLLSIESRPLALGAALGALTFLFVQTVPIFWYEAWSAALVLLALACWSERTWALSIPIALAAALMRELVAPFLCVMFVMALWERRRAEAIGWGLAIGVFGAALAVHAARVHAVSTLADKASPGWVRSGGWPFILRIVHESSALIITPLWVVAVIVPLALLGWAHWTHPLARRASLYLGGFIAAFMVVGRQNTAYWGMLLSSLLLIGVAFAPAALLSLARRVRRVA